jgi:transcriptional regulator with XRE-family HTH domain
MKLREKIKHVREERKLSQDFIAHELGLSQSQYSRRESGEIKFIAEEIIQLSKALETKIADLYGEESAVFNSHNQKGGTFGQYVTVSDKLIEQFEKRIQEKEESITLLKNQIQILSK